MFDLTNPSMDGMNHGSLPSYTHPYPATAYRSFPYAPSTSFLFNLPTSTDDQQPQRLPEFSSYAAPSQEFM